MIATPDDSKGVGAVATRRRMIDGVIARGPWWLRFRRRTVSRVLDCAAATWPGFASSGVVDGSEEAVLVLISGVKRRYRQRYGSIWIFVMPLIEIIISLIIQWWFESPVGVDAAMWRIHDERKDDV